MLYNVLVLWLLGTLIERPLGALRVLFLWLFAGGIATAISPVFVDAPWNVGTGASQAVFAFAGCAAVLAVHGAIERKRTVFLVTLAVLPGLSLDLLSAGYPKPGHGMGLMLGALCGGLWRRNAHGAKTAA